MKESPERSVEIKAPPSIVWQALAGLDKYPEWNTRVQFNGEAKQGAKIEMTVTLFKRQIKVPVLIETLKEERELRWLGGPGWLMAGSHYFKMKQSDTDPDSTIMIQGEQFSGIGVPILWLFVKRELLGLYDDINRDLKKRAEGLADG